jgi:hypothetical protein
MARFRVEVEMKINRLARHEPVAWFTESENRPGIATKVNKPKMDG